jgi:hypothetical protein
MFSSYVPDQVVLPSGSAWFKFLIDVDRYQQISVQYRAVAVGLGTEFRSEKIPRNRLGTFSVIPRKKVLIPRHSEFRGRADSEARNGTERNSAEKIGLLL